MKRILLIFFVLIACFCLLVGPVSASATVYVYDRCESTSTIDIQAGGPSLLSLSVDSTRYAEKSSSIAITGLNSTNTDFAVWSTFNGTNITGRHLGTYPVVDYVWGFWFYGRTFNWNFVAGQERQSLPYIRIFDFSNSHWFGVDFGSDGSSYRMGFVSDYTSGYPNPTFLLNNWYWIEFVVSTWGGPPLLIDLYVNGSSVGQMSSYTLTNSTVVQMFHGTGNPRYDWGLWNVDLMRFASAREFPPTNPNVDLIMTSTPYNATFVLNGTEYSYPQNFSVASGSSVSITTELGRKNPLSRSNETNTNYLFSSWTLNGTTSYSTSQTLSLASITGETSLEAVYVQEVGLMFEPNYNVGIGLVGLIFMFLSWFIGYWKVKAGEYGEGFLFWLLLFGIGFGLFTVLLGG